MAGAKHWVLSIAAVLLTVATASAQYDNCSGVVLKEKKSICNGGDGVFLPLPSHPELGASKGVQIFMYLVFMFYLFAGVALLADAFMCAIEVITSKEVIRIGDNGVTYKSQVWNPTVSNLTLMALGSSAPEIVLAIIEITGNEFYAGDLGPSTIVGSASFNLLVIIGICIVSIPADDTRTIKELTVFKITASLSIFAYIWLLLILVVISPDLIEIWEGVLTFIFCPVMVLIAFLADKGYFKQAVEKKTVNTAEFSQHVTNTELVEKIKVIAKERGLCVRDLLKQDTELVATELTRLDLGNLKFTRAIYRHEAINTALLGKKALVEVKSKNDAMFDKAQQQLIGDWTVGFERLSYQIGEEEGKIKMKVIQVLPERQTWSDATKSFFKHLQQDITCQYRTVDGSAKAGVKFEAKTGVITFSEGIHEQFIEIDIIDNDIPEDDEAFTVELFNFQCQSGKASLSKTHATARVVIIDDDKPGTISFQSGQISVNENVGTALIPVLRVGGSLGEISCLYSTKNKSAIGKHEGIDGDGDYIPVNTPIEFKFADKEISKNIEIKIVNDVHWEKDETFEVLLEEAADAASQMVGEQKFCEVTIKSDDQVTTRLEWISKVVNHNHDRFNMGSHLWGEQIYNAVTWSSEDSLTSKIIHVLLFPWKLFASLVPPTLWLGGWLSFVVALGFIALVTALIGDVAALFGCSIGLNNSITAITFVALGTSLPDTFASRTAAVNDKSADAALGNVTGSNAVNVFLGLGLPWMVAAVFWAIEGPTCEWQKKYEHVNAYGRYSKGGFVVPAKGLDVSVGIYVACSISCFALIALRRKYAGGELGGKYRWASASFLFALWGLFVVISSLYIENKL